MHSRLHGFEPVTSSSGVRCITAELRDLLSGPEAGGGGKGGGGRVPRPTSPTPGAGMCLHPPEGNVTLASGDRPESLTSLHLLWVGGWFGLRGGGVWSIGIITVARLVFTVMLVFLPDARLARPLVTLKPLPLSSSSSRCCPQGIPHSGPQYQALPESLRGSGGNDIFEYEGPFTYAKQTEWKLPLREKSKPTSLSPQ